MMVHSVRPFTRWFASNKLALLVLLWGCAPLREGGGDAPDDPGGAKDPPGVLTVSPAQVDVSLVDGADQTVSLRAVSKRRGDVTQQASWTLSDASAGHISAGKLTIRGGLEQGGAYVVTASHRNETGTAKVNVRVSLPDVIDSSAPPDAKDYFTGGGGGPAPQIAYPFDDTMMAPNVLQVALMFRAGVGQQVFKVLAEGPTYRRTFYVGSSRCSGASQCTFPVEDKAWSGMGHSSLGQTVTLTVQGSAGKGGAIGESMPIKVRFSPEDIRGGLYYFSPTIRGIKRVPLGASAPVDFIRNGDETGCAGCHAVTRDGKKVAVEFGSGQTRTGSTVVDGAMPRQRNFALNPSIAWNFSWFNPAGDKLITNWSGQLTLRDPANGQVLAQVRNDQIGGSGAAMPEWSPDGKWIAFVRYLAPSSYDFELVDSGDIAVMPYNNGAFGPAVTLVKGTPRSEVHFWPSWTPDSRWIVFNSQECMGSPCSQYNARTTRLRLVRAITDGGDVAAGEQPMELLAGTHEKHRSNNWPKVAPFLQAGRYIFVVYSANYGYGFKTGSAPQLFMFGVDLAKATSGMGDPSFQPIWLPFQEPNTGNHSAIWTTDVVCVTDKDCPVEFQCTMGMCVPRLG